jgi:superfamily II DNA or RNA helicase
MISLTEAQIQTELGSHIFHKGKSYQDNARVLSLSVSADGTFVEGKVQGSGRSPYKTKIEVTVRNGQTPFVFINGNCTCPMRFNCKHVAAVLLEAKKRFFSTEEPLPARPKTDTQHIDSLLQTVTTFSEKSKHSEFDRWIKTLDLIPVAEPLPITRNTDLELLYVLKHYPYKTHTLTIELVVAKKLKKGGYGSTFKQFSYTADTHFRAMHPLDHTILHRLEIQKRSLHRHTHSFYHYEYDIATDLNPSVLKEILSTGRCYWNSHQETIPLSMGSPNTADIAWSMDDDGKQKLFFSINQKRVYVLPLLPLWYFDPENHTCGLLETTLEPKFVQTLLASPPLLPNDIPKINTVLKKSAIPLPHAFQAIELKGLTPKPKLTVFGTRSDHPDFYRKFRKPCVLPLGRLSFIYDGHDIPVTEPATVERLSRDKKNLYTIQRHLTCEAEWIRKLLEHNIAIFDKQYPNTYIHNAKSFDLLVAPIEDEAAQEAFLYKTVPTLKAAGFEVVIDKTFPIELVVAVDDWYTEVHETTEFDWFNMEMGFVLDGEKINILPLLVKLIEKNADVFTEKYLSSLTSQNFNITLSSGQTIAVPAARIKGILATLTELYDSTSLDKSGFLSISRLRAAQLLELEKSMHATQMRWLGGDNLRKLSEKLSNFTGIEPIKIPKQFLGTLRDYQKTGVNWLNFLREYRLGGILSDDMGLGKTIQTLAHLLIEKQSGRMNKPCLIVAPTSLMENWRSESAKFSPSLEVLVLQGQERKAFFYNIQKSDIILTTYPLIVRDKEILLEHEYYMVILDEAQFIKNANTKAYAILQQIKTDHRLCLTGTPMENHLGELWSLFNFLSPGLLGDSKQFTHIFRTPIEKHGNITRRHSLNQRIKPYLLRRTKEQVVLELPPKTEIIHKIILEEEQRDLYESIRLAMESKVQNAIQSKGFSRSQIIILDALLKLRQTCCDPRLLKLEQAQKIKKSAKLSFLMDMLAELVAENKKILLFSSFTSMLALIETALQEQNISYVKLTGSTTDRKTPIQQFQNGEASVFLISLKAGGTGLNLTTADTVIHYDPWWNPAAETQATDRAHRIGQTKPVFVYKLVTTGTVEEKILKMQDKKRALLESLFDENQGAKAGKISADDLKYLFQGIDTLETI